MKVIFERRQEEAPTIHTFYFKTQSIFKYQSGQYIELTLKHPGADNFGEKRHFSLSSSPEEECISITSKFTARDGSSFKQALLVLKPGTELSVSAPMGKFVLPKNLDQPLIFVAGGIGITPFRSMLATIGLQQERRQIKLFYGVNTEDEIIFKSILRSLGSNVTTYINKPSSSWLGKKAMCRSRTF